MIVLAADHKGYELKEEIKKFFNNENILTIDVGTYSPDSVDYPDFAALANKKVLESPNNVGIYICYTGIGMSMSANRNPKIRAALCSNKTTAALSRRHNDANVLVLPAKVVSKNKAISIIKEFLTVDFEGGRHQKRVKKLEKTKF
ncbi:MAG: ribose 5-phosphate isomerase B [Christensenellales bacterium]